MEVLHQDQLEEHKKQDIEEVLVKMHMELTVQVVVATMAVMHQQTQTTVEAVALDI